MTYAELNEKAMTPAGWKVTAFTPTGPVVARSCWFYDYIELIAPAGQAPLEGARPVYDLPVWNASSWMRPSYPRVLCGQILGVVHSEPKDEKPYQRLIYGVQGEPRSQAYLDLEPVAFSAFATAAATATRLVYEPASYGFPNPEQLEAMGADICDLKGHRQGATHGADQFAVQRPGPHGLLLQRQLGRDVVVVLAARKGARLRRGRGKLLEHAPDPQQARGTGGDRSMNATFEDTIQEVAGDIDWHLLARQKAAAVELAMNPAIDPHYKEMMTGIVNFLDNFQDAAADKLGLPVVFLHEDGFKDKDGNPVPEPPRAEHPFVAAVRELLNSGNKETMSLEGWPGVVVSDDAYAQLRKILHDMTGSYAGLEV